MYLSCNVLSHIFLSATISFFYKKTLKILTSFLHSLPEYKLFSDWSLLQITDHTYQSMKDRFKRQILPNIRSYSIPKPWISALTGLTADAKTSPGQCCCRFCRKLLLYGRHYRNDCYHD